MKETSKETFSLVQKATNVIVIVYDVDLTMLRLYRIPPSSLQHRLFQPT